MTPQSNIQIQRPAWQRWLLPGLVLLAALVRIYWGVQPRVAWGDEPFYIWLGDSLLRGQGYEFFGISAVHHSPLFALLAALAARLLPAIGPAGSAQDVARGSIAIYVLTGALLVLPIHGMARRLRGDSAGLAAGLITALYPILTSGVLLWGTMTEPLFLLLVASAWWGLLISLQDNRTLGYVVTGLMLGLAYLTRNEAIVYLVAGYAALLILRATLGHQAAQWRKTLGGLVLAVVIFFVVISPYLIALRERTGQWQLLEEAGSAYTSMEGLVAGNANQFDKSTWGLDPATNEVFYFSSTSETQGFLDAILANPTVFLRRLLINSRLFLAKVFSVQLVPWPIAVLAVLGLFAVAWDANRLRGELLLAVSLAGPLTFVLFFVQERYLAGVLIPTLVWAGEGLAWLGIWLADTWAELRGHPTARAGDAPQSGRSVSLLHALPAVLVALLLLWQQPRLWNSMRQVRSFQPDHLAAAAELRQLGASPDTVVMSRYPAVALHAGAHWAPTPAASWPEVAAYARQHEVRYLVLDGWEAELRPQISFLLTPSQAPPELRYLTTLESGRDPVVIYEFTGS